MDFSHFGKRPQAGDSSTRPRSAAVFAWQLRWRLLLVVALILLGPSLLFRVVPSLRPWLGLPEPPVPSQPLTEAEIANELVDTRLLPPPDAPLLPDVEPVVGGLSGAGVSGKVRSKTETAGPDTTSPLRDAEQDRWSRLWDGLEPAQKTLLQLVLKSSRGKTTLSEADRQDSQALLRQLEENWKQHSQEARNAVQQLAEDERAAWIPVVDQLDAGWNSTLHPALAGAARGETLPEAQRLALRDLQRILDGIALKLVRDNTIIRSVEGDAWFRLLEQLDGQDPRRLAAAAMGRVGFVQLYKQPQEYRGQLVTVRGDARLGYWVSAPVNRHGVAGYYVFWLQPAGGPNRPIVIYALQKPAGFPELADKATSPQGTSLNHRLEVTGYFLKNWAYPAQDHTRLAPLLLAQVPLWEQQAAGSEQLPPMRAAITALLVAIAVSFGLITYVYFKTPSSGRRGSARDATVDPETPIVIGLPPRSPTKDVP